MSLDYTGANTGVFTRLGRIVKVINSYATLAETTIPANLKTIADPFEAADDTLIIDGIYTGSQGFQDQVTGWRQQYAAYGDATLTDFATVLTPLGIIDASLNAVLPALYTQMSVDGKTVQKCTVTLGSVTPGSLNTGTGTALVTKVLDGYNAPIVGGLSHILLNGVNSELAVTAETMSLTCTADSMQDGTSEGAEQFAWNGGIAEANLDWRTEGSGRGPTLTVANASTLVNDGDFENWGGTGNNTPSNWTIANGTAGTHILREATNVYRGTYALKILGTGAQAIIGVQQSITAGTLTSKRRYCVPLRLKASAVPAAGQVEVSFSGTGYARTVPTDEVQTLQISGTPAGGTYTISFTGPFGGTQTTGALAFNASSSAVQTALRALAGLECVVVTTAAGAPPNVTHQVTFYGLPGPQGLLTADITGLTGGAPAKTIAQTTAGVEGDCVILPAAAFPTAWKLAWLWINTPAILPSDWALTVQVTGTLSNTVALYADSLAMKEVTYHGGIGVVLVAGATRFLDGDRLTWTLNNDNLGVWNTFFRQRYSFQLVSSGSPNLADALAT